MIPPWIYRFMDPRLLLLKSEGIIKWKVFIIDKSVCLFIFPEAVYSFILSKAVCYLFIKGCLFVFCPWWFVYLFPRLFICLRIFSTHKTLLMTTAQGVVRLPRTSDFGDPRQKLPLHHTVDNGLSLQHKAVCLFIFPKAVDNILRD